VSFDVIEDAISGAREHAVLHGFPPGGVASHSGVALVVVRRLLQGQPPLVQPHVHYGARAHANPVSLGILLEGVRKPTSSRSVA
jgi:hypothetical protein